MNSKEQFYQYMNAMSPTEMQECLQMVLLLARSKGLDITPSNDVTTKLKRLQVSNRVWFQHALVSKFSKSDTCNMTLGGLGQAAVDLFSEPNVAEYVTRVNKSIDEELNKEVLSMNVVSPMANDGSVPLEPVQLTAVAESVSSDVVTQSSLTEQAHGGTDDYEFLVSDSDSDLESVSEASEDESVVTTLQKRQRTTAAKTRFVWTPELDEELRVAVSNHKHESWKAVAHHMGRGIDYTTCKKRWNGTLKHKQQGLREDNQWTKEEETQLALLVAKHTIQPYWSNWAKSMTVAHVDWTAIGNETGRMASKCQNRWVLVKNRSRK